ncbi:TIGR04141 family sporadically distributed protein, partial [Escherichia coli]|nr:TIGR04141 family sporadically distributed protein [Escherichia coli]
KITNDANNGHTASLKEILSITYTEGSEHYFLKRGNWNKFNTAFMKYLSNSLKNITFEIKDDLKEVEFNTWQSIKAQQITQGNSKDKLDYREYWFNEKMANEQGYKLLDRQLTKITSISEVGKDYNVEVADLYKNGELIAVKISD